MRLRVRDGREFIDAVVFQYSTGQRMIQYEPAMSRLISIQLASHSLILQILS